ILLQLILVFGDKTVGRPYNGFGRAVILLQLKYLYIIIIALVVEDVTDVGPAESIDRLGIIAHHANISKFIGQRFHNEILGVVGILVLIHHNVAEALLVLAEYLREFSQQYKGVKKEVVKVHGARAETPFCVS